MTHHLVGAAEVAKILGVTRQRVAQLAVSGFPAPEVELIGGRIWSRHDIESWAVKNHDRGPRPRFEGDHGWALHRLTFLAGEEAHALGHGHLGSEHAVVAMLRPDCPGAARQVLASFGASLDDFRARARKIGGPATTTEDTQVITPHFQIMCERAKLEAERLSDEVVSTHHFLLALSDDGRSLRNWFNPDVAPDRLRQRVLEVTDATLPDEVPDEEFLRRKAKSRLASEAIGSHALPSYQLRSDGVDPQDRRPWGSLGFFGQSWWKKGMPVQCTVDCDGVPVLGPSGRLFTTKTDEDGFMVVGSDGKFTDEEFDLPEGAEVTWPSGFEPPAGASPQLRE